jgi:hypothetical protein
VKDVFAGACLFCLATEMALAAKAGASAVWICFCVGFCAFYIGSWIKEKRDDH